MLGSKRRYYSNREKAKLILKKEDLVGYINNIKENMYGTVTEEENEEDDDEEEEEEEEEEERS